jgi:hypothetical protein
MADFVDPLGALSMLSAPVTPGLSSLLPATTAAAPAAQRATAPAAKTAPHISSATSLAASSELSIDPLSGLSPSAPSASAPSNVKHSPYLDWNTRKAVVLKEFTVTGNIAVSAVCSALCCFINVPTRIHFIFWMICSPS